MSERTALSERVQQFVETVDLMEASLEYIERLIAWSEREPLVQQEPPGEAGPCTAQFECVPNRGPVITPTR